MLIILSVFAFSDGVTGVPHEVASVCVCVCVCVCVSVCVCLCVSAENSGYGVTQQYRLPPHEGSIAI